MRDIFTVTVSLLFHYHPIIYAPLATRLRDILAVSGQNSGTEPDGKDAEQWRCILQEGSGQSRDGSAAHGTYLWHQLGIIRAFRGKMSLGRGCQSLVVLASSSSET